MRIGIASCYSHHNYGSMLQAYATQKVIEELGCEAITIASYRSINYMTQSKARYYYHKITNKDILLAKIRLVLSRLYEKRFEDVVAGQKERSQYFDTFYKTHFKLSDLNKDRNELTSFSKTCDAVIAGSDQLWNPINVEHDYFTLTFVPDSIKKIAYATSIGTTVIPSYQKNTYLEFLDRFNYISVREDSAKDTLEKLGVKNKIEVVLDPTLLFTGKEWMDIQNEERIVKDKYIFCYYLGVNPQHREFANKIKELTGYKIVALQHLDEFVKDDLNFGDMKPYNVGPSEFLNLIRNAEYVCTDSFHGTCFSILNHKKFFTLNRHMATNSQSTNSRIDSLLGGLGLENRRANGVLDEDTISKLINTEIDYKTVDPILEKKRTESKEFLKNAIWDK